MSDNSTLDLFDQYTTECFNCGMSIHIDEAIWDAECGNEDEAIPLCSQKCLAIYNEDEEALRSIRYQEARDWWYERLVDK